MSVLSRRVGVTLLVLGCAPVALAQPADDVIDESIAAITPAGDIAGSVEILDTAPNKSRSVIKADLTALGPGPLDTLRVDVPQIGQQVEQTTEFLDYRDVEGIKMPFELRATSSLQNSTITITKVADNVDIDPALFSKPATP